METKKPKHNFHLQTVVFNRDDWSLNEAKSWLKKNDLKDDVDIKPTQYRFRQSNPGLYSSFMSKPVKTGLLLVFGYRDHNDYYNGPMEGSHRQR